MSVRGYSVDGRINLGAFVEPEVKRQLVEAAFHRGVSLSDEIRLALREHLEQAREPLVEAAMNVGES